MITERTTEERLSYLERLYAHVATKADLAGAVGRLESQIAGIEGRILRWIVPSMVASLVGGMGVAAAVARLVD